MRALPKTKDISHVFVYRICGICEAWLMAAVWIIRQVFSSAAAFCALVSLCENKQIWCNEQILCGIFQSQNLANICCCWIFWMNAPRCERNRLECEAICRYMCVYVCMMQVCISSAAVRDARGESIDRMSDWIARINDDFAVVLPSFDRSRSIYK